MLRWSSGSPIQNIILSCTDTVNRWWFLFHHHIDLKRKGDWWNTIVQRIVMSKWKRCCSWNIYVSLRVIMFWFFWVCHFSPITVAHLSPWKFCGLVGKREGRRQERCICLTLASHNSGTEIWSRANHLSPFDRAFMCPWSFLSLDLG